MDEQEFDSLNSRRPILDSLELPVRTSHSGQLSMKMLWCWRCKTEVPMLDDDEWKRVSSLFNTGTEGDSKQRMFAAALLEYERITGFHETNPNVLYDHH